MDVTKENFEEAVATLEVLFPFHACSFERFDHVFLCQGFCLISGTGSHCALKMGVERAACEKLPLLRDVVVLLFRGCSRLANLWPSMRR
jgi:hypothetical protein